MVVLDICCQWVATNEVEQIFEQIENKSFAKKSYNVEKSQI